MHLGELMNLSSLVSTAVRYHPLLHPRDVPNIDVPVRKSSGPSMMAW